MHHSEVVAVQALDARYVPARLGRGLLLTIVLAMLGVLAAVAGVFMGWLLAAVMLGSAGNTIAKMSRREPVVTVDAAGVTDHRVPLTVAWENVASMRTVDRRVILAQTPLLELVPAQPLPREPKRLLAAVARGDLAFGDARDRERVMIDLRHLDRSPEEVLAAARRLRSSHGNR